MHRLPQSRFRTAITPFLGLPLALAAAFTPSAWAYDSPVGQPQTRLDSSNRPVESKEPRATPHAITLSAQASREVMQDKVQLTVFYEQQANNAAALSTILRQKTEEALRIAKSAQGVSVQTRNFTVYPKTDDKGRITVWQGRTELLLECTNAEDLAPIGRVAGQLAPIMQVSNLRFSLSPQAEQSLNAQLADEAIAAFRSEAQRTAKAFGYAHYALADIAVHRNNFQIQGSTMMATARGLAVESADIPIARGKTTLSVVVSGVIHVMN